MPVTRHDPRTIIRNAAELRQAGVDASCASRHADALRLLRRGMDLLDSIHPVAPEFHQDWLRTRIRMSVSLAFTEADKFGFSEGLDQLTAVRTLIHEFPDPEVRAELLEPLDHNHGLLLMSAGRCAESIAYFDSSLDYQRECLRQAADPVPLIESLLNTLATRGIAFTRLGRLAEAHADLRRGLLLARRYQLPGSIADIRRHLGSLALRTGDVPAALRHYDRSEQDYLDHGLEVPTLLGLAQAQALLVAGLAKEAAAHLDEVLPIMHERQSANRELADAEFYRATAGLLNDEIDLVRRLAHSAGRRMRQWGCRICVANAALLGLRADVREALRGNEIPARLHTRATQLAESMDAEPVPLDIQAAVARMLAARLEIRSGRTAPAAALLAQVPTPQPLHPIDYRMLRRLCRAELAVPTQGPGAALAEISAGLTELEEVRDRMGALELVSGTALHGRELADLAVRLVLAEGDPRRLFDWVERTRAQSYRYEPRAEPDARTAERMMRTRQLVAPIGPTEHEVHALAQTRRAVEVPAPRAAYPLGWHVGQRGAARPTARLDAVAAQLGRRALVSFVASADELVALVVRDGEARLVRLGSVARAEENARMLDADLGALAPDGLPAKLTEVVMTSARRQAALLDEQLVAPLAGLLGDRELVIVPADALYAVPWGVLPGLRSRPVVVTPSATAWLAAERAEPARGGAVVLVCGPRLPHAQAEIDRLATRYARSTVRSGAGATVDSVLDAMDGAALTHVAAHGAHEPENALFSRLELADGVLFAHQITALRRPPRQVVLAACELALNRIRPGTEPLGFASALLASGSVTVIAPVNRVGDQAAAAAMHDYHTRLARGDRPAVALAATIAADPMRRPFLCLGAG